MGTHERIANARTDEPDRMEQAILAIFCSGLTPTEMSLLDGGRSSAEIEQSRSAVTEVFILSVRWALVTLISAGLEACEREDFDRAKSSTYARLWDMCRELDEQAALHGVLQNGPRRMTH